MHHPTDRITHTTAFVTPIMDHWLEREIAQWVVSEGFLSENRWRSSLSSDPCDLQTDLSLEFLDLGGEFLRLLDVMPLGLALAVQDL